MNKTQKELQQNDSILLQLLYDIISAAQRQIHYLNLRFLAASDFFLRFTLGFS